MIIEENTDRNTTIELKAFVNGIECPFQINSNCITVTMPKDIPVPTGMDAIHTKVPYDLSISSALRKEI
jgi:hypothetical protein